MLKQESLVDLEMIACDQAKQQRQKLQVLGKGDETSGSQMNSPLLSLCVDVEVCVGGGDAPKGGLGGLQTLLE